MYKKPNAKQIRAAMATAGIDLANFNYVMRQADHAAHNQRRNNRNFATFH